MLLPALAKAKGSATGIYCLNNHRQLLTAWKLYVNDSNDRLPPNAKHVLDPGLDQWLFEFSSEQSGQYQPSLSGWIKKKDRRPIPKAWSLFPVCRYLQVPLGQVYMQDKKERPTQGAKCLYEWIY